jgi:hypothetical protein
MNIENLNRAARIAQEYKKLCGQLTIAEQMRESKNGFTIADHSDGSGLNVGYFYNSDGNYDVEIYEKIINVVIACLESKRDRLAEEAVSL